MKYRELGKTGIEVSEISFGAWAIGGGWGEQSDEESIAALHKAIDLGVRFIDTAAGYGDGRSEQVIARVLKERSEEVAVATKTPPAAGPWPPSPYCDWEDRYSETYLRENIEQRLRYLDTDCIDLLQLHTWTRAWNRDPKPFEILKKLKEEGKIRAVGISTPEHDQNSVIDLMKGGYVDSVQVIYNIFEQEPAAELLPVARECGVGIIVRVAFDEGSLTGKFELGHQFGEGDFRGNYFAGDRLDRSIRRVDAIKADIEGSGLTMPQFALKYVLEHPAVSCVIPGMRNVRQAELNCVVSDLPGISEEHLLKMRGHAWNRGFWYGGK
ncbi:aldo/keto reductase [Pelagicoccus mobilis]|uniref:Aldo/keto reductase n=1 Tax=Pelagicoccus mobilis TaxID=415221 RepID=A0A934VRP9_9BACT|nr:aldo/keto reductase [Pelagicoccus mobilis]MBK1878180.1 aldo/keto reductase [Pelagicoccus mobilis]